MITRTHNCSSHLIVITPEYFFPYGAGAHEFISKTYSVAALLFIQAANKKNFIHNRIINFTKLFCYTMQTLHPFFTIGGTFNRRVINFQHHIIHIAQNAFMSP